MARPKPSGPPVIPFTPAPAPPAVAGPEDPTRIAGQGPATISDDDVTNLAAALRGDVGGIVDEDEEETTRVTRPKQPQPAPEPPTEFSFKPKTSPPTVSSEAPTVHITTPSQRLEPPTVTPATTPPVVSSNDPDEEAGATVLFRRPKATDGTESAAPAPAPASVPMNLPATPQAGPVTGWLVIMKGPGRGNSFALGYGVHFVGRGDDQRIPLRFGDHGISRDKHVAVTYDGVGRSFYISQGTSSALAYLNGKPVLQVLPLTPQDTIRLGETELVLVPFCGSHFDWQEA